MVSKVDSWPSPDYNNSLAATNNSESDYDYDYDFYSLVIPVDELLLVTLVYTVTLAFGTVGNTLVIVCILCYKRMHTVTNTFLLSLTSADLLLVAFCVPIKVSCL
jgi:hypothetical protein